MVFFSSKKEKNDNNKRALEKKFDKIDKNQSECERKRVREEAIDA